ncbi:MAG: DUF202 domain-containing protein [Solirubrobacterales bacterium]
MQEVEDTSPEAVMPTIIRLNEQDAGLSNERTLLAWYRAAISALAMSVAAGKLVPSLAQGTSELWLAAGAVFAMLAVAFTFAGLRSYRAMRITLAATAGDAGEEDEPAAGALPAIGAGIITLAVICGLLVALDR